jgi:hypothetical protein
MLNDHTQKKSYIIKNYDTLWDLAYKFYKDPEQWPKIWKENNYIKDPHWIYPGHRLVIPDVYTQNNSNEEISLYKDYSENRNKDTKLKSNIPLKDDTEVENRDNNKEPQQYFNTPQKNSTLNYELKNILNKGYIGKDMIRQVGFLWTTRDEKNLVAPGNAYIDGDKHAITYHQFERVHCTIFGQHNYEAGDTVDIIHPEKYIKINGSVVNLVFRVALGKINKINSSSMEITLIKMWNIVRNKDRITAAQPFDNYRIDSLLPVTREIKGNIVTKVEPTVSPYLYQTLIINRGTNHGVQFGDIFQVFSYNMKKTTKHLTMICCAINIQAESSSLLILKMYNTKLQEGDEVNLIKRIKFK